MISKKGVGNLKPKSIFREGQKLPKQRISLRPNLRKQLIKLIHFTLQLGDDYLSSFNRYKLFLFSNKAIRATKVLRQLVK